MDDEVSCWDPPAGQQIPGETIGILDMDAFELQVYLKLKYPRSWTQLYNTRPAVLVQAYGNILLSLNYKAKAEGLSRRMKLPEARNLVHDLLVLTKDIAHGKPESRNLRRTSQEVFLAIQEYKSLKQMRFTLERASNDEFFFDLTSDVKQWLRINSTSDITEADIGPNTHLEGRSKRISGRSILYKLQNVQDRPDYMNEVNLIIGGTFMRSIADFIYLKTNLSSSCGLGSNKLMAKLGVSAHKPSGVTILPEYGLSRFSRQIKIDSIPGLQGELGKTVLTRAQRYFDKHSVSMHDLQDLNFREFMECLGFGPVRGRKYFRLLNGDSVDQVTPKTMSDSVSSSKKLTYPRVFLRDFSTINQTIFDLSCDLSEKLVDDNSWNNRTAQVIKAKFTFAKKSSCQPPSIYMRNESFTFSIPHTFYTPLIEEYAAQAQHVRGDPLITHVILKATFNPEPQH